MSSELLEFNRKKVSVSSLISNEKYACVGGPFGSSLTIKDYVDYEGVPVSRGSNLKIGSRQFIDKDFVFVSFEKAKELANNSAGRGDIVLTQRGTIGQVAIIPKNSKYERYILSQNQMKITLDESRVDSLFFLYYFLSKEVQEEIQRISIGGVIPGFNLTQFRSFEVALPSLAIQKNIASFLDSLDSRIELLRETNTILESIAQTLFKSWFVDFDPVHANAGTQAPSLPPEIQSLFPSTFVESPLGAVPEGWGVGTLSNCCKKVESGGTPKRNVPEYWNGDVSWLSSGEVRQPIVFDTKEKITQLGVSESSAKLWPSGTTVVAMYGATAGEVCLLANPSTANQACCGLIPKEYSRSFLFFCVRRERENLASKSSGSAQQNLNKGIVAGHEILLPSDQIFQEFENSTAHLLDGWIANEKKMQTLSSLRDTLLPRLISGQLRLLETDSLIGELA